MSEWEDVGIDSAPRIGWPRAILTAVAITAVGIAALVFGVNAILTRIHGLDRSTRVGIATTAFLFGILAIAWALRRLQRRGLI